MAETQYTRDFGTTFRVYRDFCKKKKKKKSLKTQNMEP